MRPVQDLIRRVAIASAILMLGIATGCSKPADKPNEAAGSATSQRQASKLGDLSEFRNVAVDVLGPRRQERPGGRQELRIKDLETTWDSAEAGIKPRAANDWHVLDKAIDRALSALRDGNPNQADCKASMDDLLKAFDVMKG